MEKKKESTPENLKEIIELIEQSAEDSESISVGMIVRTLGSRSFGPILLVAGLITLAPFPSGVPGVPTTMGALVLLVTVQLLIGRNYFWLPRFISKRALSREKFRKGVSWVRPIIRVLDYISKPRLRILESKGQIYVIAVICLLVALTMPFMEFIPFSANIAGVTFTLFGLALTAHDGLLALLGLLFVIAVTGSGLYYFII